MRKAEKMKMKIPVNRTAEMKTVLPVPAL